jgi:hypothetical protein
MWFPLNMTLSPDREKSPSVAARLLQLELWLAAWVYFGIRAFTVSNR